MGANDTPELMCLSSFLKYFLKSTVTLHLALCLFLKISLFLAVLGIHCCVGFSLAVMTYSSLECVASHCDGSLVAEHRLSSSGAWA